MCFFLESEHCFEVKSELRFHLEEAVSAESQHSSETLGVPLPENKLF